MVFALSPPLTPDTWHLERVKKFGNEQNQLAQRRKDAEAEKKIKELFVPNLSASASLREIV
jgi:hypothetical protein